MSVERDHECVVTLCALVFPFVVCSGNPAVQQAKQILIVGLGKSYGYGLYSDGLRDAQCTSSHFYCNHLDSVMFAYHPGQNC